MDHSTLEGLLPRWQQSGAKTEVIGYSVLGRPLYAVHVGDDSPHQQIVTAAMHAREHLTADIVASQIDYTLSHLSTLAGGVWFVPLCNPDGVNLCLHGDQSLDVATAAKLRAINGGRDFSLWKASARAVDLNCNFDAGWGTGKGNLFVPAPSSYVGEIPHSEPETRALVEFTKRVRPFLTVSYHSKGREIYWEFGQSGKRALKDRAIAAKAAEHTGYSLVDGTLGSAGGYKDYCVGVLGISALTIEAFDDVYAHPVPAAAVEEERERTDGLAIRLNEE